MKLRNFLLPKKSDSNLALLGPINDRTVQSAETTEVKGSLATLAREMAKQQMMRDQQRDNEGDKDSTFYVKTPSLLTRLVETRGLLDEAFKTLSSAAARKIDVSPAGDWLLDNYHIVKEHITEIKRSMPKNYYAELPKLSAGPWAGYPRVYEMTMNLISGTEGVVDVDVANMFISEFKRTHLRMGELWAFPIMLRLGLIGNIWRMTKRALDRLADIEAADKWAEELTQKGTHGNLAVLRFMTERPQLTPTFVTRLFTRTRSYQSGSSSPLYWLEKYITEEGVDAEECSRQETLQLSLTRSVMANSITSLKKISQGDWLSFFEAHSETDRILRADPSGHYPLMNFETRDRYRHVVEGFALSTSLLEEKVAQIAINLAKAARDEYLDTHQPPVVDTPLNESTDGEEKESPTPRSEESIDLPVTAHVGYWLEGDGKKVLEEEIGYKRPFGYILFLALKRYPHLFFFSSIIILTWLLMLWLYTILPEGLGTAQFILAALCVFMLANDTAIGLVNQIVTRSFPPLLLPMLDFVKRPVPKECKTIVVVPTLFPSVQSVESSIEQLEVHYLANRDSNILFGLLSDFTDAPKQTMPNDEAILTAAKKGLKQLNRRHGDGSFFLFHRPRLFNPQQGLRGVWMGWERKRGKLVQFNQFLLDLNVGKVDKSNFILAVGDLSLLEGTRYVMTLDADTVLPRDAAKQMIGMIAHPLNRAVVDEKHHRVVQGYGIIQPRVTTMITSRASKFATINSGKPGVDPYTTAVSDVYQDLFAEGSYTGKGIYDLKAFVESTEGRFPDNTILSHDLIEGSYARAGLATNIEVFDDYPSHYLAYSKRKHRWVRGDWQLLRWGVGFMATFSQQKKERIKLSSISRWKIFDNLRRSVVEIDQFLFFLLVWFVFPSSWFVPGTCLAIGFLIFPWVLSFTVSAILPPSDGETSMRAYYREVFLDGYNSVIQLLVSLTFMPHQSLIVLDAIIRTLFRLVHRRNLLEWVTASQVESMLQKNAKATWLQMWDAVALSTSVTLLLLLRMSCTFQLDDQCEPASLMSWFMALPILGAWLAAPSLANALSTTQQQQTKEELSPSDRKSALRYALLHWRFYDSFVTADTKWLPPDNFQEDPTPVIAMRTSPTNIAMHLLSTVSAYDLGFITAGRLVDLIEKTFASLDRMPRFRGHFYNWYDLNYLSVLNPPYVSTVDSGNLAGSFLALKQAFLSLGEESVWPEARYKDALVGALSIVLKLLGMGGDIGDGDPYERDTRKDLVKLVHRVLMALQNSTEGQLRGMLRSCAQDLNLHLDMVKGQEASPVFREVQYWLQWTQNLINLLLNDELLAHHHSIKGGSSSFAHLAATSPSAAALLAKFRKLSARAEAFAMDMDFTFLFDRQHKLFSIGFNTATNEADRSLYDLLASESRLASYIAVAKNDVPVEHWFRLGRSLVGCGALVSWSGTMFEYLMPLILMESFPNTLLNRTNHAVIQAQIAYTARVHSGSPHVPWGISESAYNFRNREGTYQYRAFGVPDLALKRGQGKDYVVAPYASMLALHVKPTVAMENLALLESIGSLGPYGFRDSVDYTRPAAYAELAVVGNYMAHHIGMSMATLDNVLNGLVWVKRFHADTLVSSAKLLLHERVPRQVSLVQAAVSESGFERQPAVKPGDDQVVVREFTTPDTPQPRVGLLGMLPYSILVTNAGGGYSYWGDLAVTRWSNDCTMDNTGQWIYIKDLTSKRTWSAAHQPICAPPDEYKVTFAVDCVVFQRRDGPILSSTKIAVNTNHLAEVRCLTLTNTADEPHTVEVTSYGEIVLQPPAADKAHPAFGNLFIETEWIENVHALLAYRRPRAAGNTIPYLVHVVALSGNAQVVGEIQYETDRSRFLGRGRSIRNPAALDDGAKLSGRVGAVLDPIFSIRVTVVVPPGQAVSISYTNLVSDQKQQLLNRADLYSDISAARRTFEITSSQMQEELHDLNITAEDAMLFQMLVGHMLFRQQAFASSHKLTRNRLGREGLWAHGISGDWPICLVLIDGEKGLKAFRQTLQAHRYWRQKGVVIDIVVVNTQPPTYLQDLQDQLLSAVTSSSSAKLIDKPGGIFLRRKEMLPPENFFLLQAIARVHIHCGMGALTMSKFDVPDEFYNYQPPFEPLTADGLVVEPPRTPLSPLPRRHHTSPGSTSLLEKEKEKEKLNLLLRQKEKEQEKPLPPLDYWNGYGGFTEEGYYEIRLIGDKVPPAPWANVVANASAGFLVTETGGGFTWAQSSFFFRLTPWTNDPVTDRPGEVIYIRDDMDGEVWSCTPAPVRHQSLYRVVHQQGATTFEHEHKGIATKLTMGMAEGQDLKISVVELRNTSPRKRRLSVASYVEWSLGQTREHTQHQIYTFVDAATEALCARNCFDSHFAQFMAFSWASEPTSGYTCDRREFIGRNGSLARPAGLARVGLSEVVGAGHDPCAVKQMTVELASGERKKIVILLGVAKDAASMQEMLRKYGKVSAYERALHHSVEAWAKRISVFQVKTPSHSMDTLLNKWVLYQAWACRVWGRSGFYQSSGAFGFRDQLQDVMALVYSDPNIARHQIILSASRQFKEGDVQHWWHPHNGQGIRSRISDDLVWLPFVVDHYIAVTGDYKVLDEVIPFLQMRQLNENEDDIYDQPHTSEEKGTIYEHCIRAIKRASTSGVHDLPLIGSGDWNDGMNKVGAGGKGESVWLAWFLVATIQKFLRYCRMRGDNNNFEQLTNRMAQYKLAAERAWDGQWYRRAYYDDGTALGSSSSDECKIDSLSQSWSIISGAGDPQKVDKVLEAVDNHLVHNEGKLIMLLTPAFDRGDHNPGYIKGYLPGVRENGAQYTHAAVWVVLANCFAQRGQRAFELFELINPINHANDEDTVETYKTEPYALCGDVYTATGNVGRGGWSWYTGSASWLYRTGIEAILGIRKTHDRLEISPCIPPEWSEYEVIYRHSDHLRYHIVIQNPHHVATGVVSVRVDDKEMEDLAVPLPTEEQEHVTADTPSPASSLSRSSSSVPLASTPKEDSSRKSDIRIVVDSPEDEKGKERIRDVEDEPAIEHKDDLQEKDSEKANGEREKERERDREEREKELEAAHEEVPVKEIKVVVVMGYVEPTPAHEEHSAKNKW